LLLALLPILALLVLPAREPDKDAPGPKAVLVVHGGEGDLPEKSPPELEKKIRDTMTQALRNGYDAMQKPGGTSLDAVEAAIRVLEDSPLFNAGKGAVFTRDGHNEMDAAIMEGKDKKAGAVAGVTTVKNPIRAARAVMEHSPHVLLTGRGAELFAIKQKLDIEHPDYFWTEHRWKELQEELRKQEKKDGKPERQGRREDGQPSWRGVGTVGAVALDKSGNLAAGTSTGGLTAKWSGRVGDSPIIGAGTYADNETCAVSCTGVGEFFIRYTVSYDIAALMKYKNRSVRQAVEEVVGKLKKVGGPGGVEGGVIALDREGHFAVDYNAEQMTRGHVTDKGKISVAVTEKSLPEPK
jgi:beta-aspartyl-peptidase (threonine type)